MFDEVCYKWGLFDIAYGEPCLFEDRKKRLFKSLLWMGRVMRNSGILKCFNTA